MFTEMGMQMLLDTFVYGLAAAAPWLLGAGILIVALTRGEARRALLSFIRAARRRTAPPGPRAEDVHALYERIQDLEARVMYAERALLKQIAGSSAETAAADRIVVPPQLLRTPV